MKTERKNHRLCTTTFDSERIKDMSLDATTYPSSAQCIQQCFAFLSYVLIPTLSTPEDVLHIQASAVVHFHNGRGVTETSHQLSDSLEAMCEWQ